MKKKTFLFSLIVSASFFSCTKEVAPLPPPPDFRDDVIGNFRGYTRAWGNSNANSWDNTFPDSMMVSKAYTGTGNINIDNSNVILRPDYTVVISSPNNIYFTLTADSVFLHYYTEAHMFSGVAYSSFYGRKHR